MNIDHSGVFDMSSDQRLRLGPRTRSVVCAFDSGRRTRTPDSVRRFASDSVHPKKSQTEFLPVISDSVRGLMSVRDVKKQTILFLQTADVWFTSYAAEGCRCGPQTADVLASKKQTSPNKEVKPTRRALDSNTCLLFSKAPKKPQPDTPSCIR
ncbi:hypothetical protein LXL04_015351 [Taraxacum kok-saghyz]